MPPLPQPPTAARAARGTQDRPWWTSGSKWALAFIVGSNIAVLLTIFVPEISHWRDRHLQQQIARANQNLESLNRQVEITRLLFDHFFGRSAREQTAVVQYLTYQFPHDLRKKSLQAILVLEAKPAVRKEITKSVASVQPHPVGQSRVDLAIAGERQGFRLVIKGDLANARNAFLRAYNAYPTYHNVDELSHTVLTPQRLADYARSQSPRILRDTISTILTAYSWGIPPDLLKALQQKYNSLS